MERQDLVIRCGMLVGMFVFLALGVLALGGESDFVFDRFLAAGFFLFFLLSYKRMGLKLPVLLVGLGALILHHLKLYGQTYFGWLQFDMVMHFVGSFALALILHQYLSTCEGMGCSGKAKVACLAVLAAAGLGTFIEITEYFGYAKLPAGEGILHYGLGDEGDWADSISDMMFNLLGATLGVLMMTLAHHIKRRNVKNLKLFLAS
jgi:uncharacterized membrane protein YjdF